MIHLSKRHTQRGFSLIEILVVIVIISIISTVAVISIRFNQNKQFETIAKQLMDLIRLAEQEAMYRPATMGLGITPHAYQFFIFNEKTRKWDLFTDANLKQHRFPHNTVLTLKSHKTLPEQKNQPSLIIPPSGDTSPFTIFIGKENQFHYKITGNGNGEFTIATVE